MLLRCNWKGKCFIKAGMWNNRKAVPTDEFCTMTCLRALRTNDSVLSHGKQSAGRRAGDIILKFASSASWPSAAGRPPTPRCSRCRSPSSGRSPGALSPTPANRYFCNDFPCACQLLPYLQVLAKYVSVIIIVPVLQIIFINIVMRNISFIDVKIFLNSNFYKFPFIIETINFSGFNFYKLCQILQ